MRYLWCVVLMLVLGCGSGEQQATPETPAPEVAAPDTASVAPADSI